jgi:hypothetical protein
VAELDNVARLAGRGADHGYEVWFLTLTDRASGQGFWIRSTHHAPRRGAHSGAVWFARFDPSDPQRTFGIHRSFDMFSFDDTRFDARVGGTVMSSGSAEGSIFGDGHQASWRLEWPTGEPTYRLLPDWMYRGSFAPTKPFSPNVATHATGEVVVDGERVELSGAPAQQGHLAGSRHAERWAWAHCADLDGEDAVVHALTAQGRRGPFVTPFVTSVGVRWDGRWIRLRKVSRARDFALGTWRIDVGNRRYRLAGRIEAPARDLVRARYVDPDGTDRFCHNSEIASCRLALFERHAGGFDEVALLESRGGTHAEWAGRTPAHAVERDHVDVTDEPVAAREGGGT